MWTDTTQHSCVHTKWHARRNVKSWNTTYATTLKLDSHPAPACRTCVDKQRIRVYFACLKFAVRLDDLHADVCSCMLGMRNKKTNFHTDQLCYIDGPHLRATYQTCLKAKNKAACDVSNGPRAKASEILPNKTTMQDSSTVDHSSSGMYLLETVFTSSVPNTPLLPLFLSHTIKLREMHAAASSSGVATLLTKRTCTCSLSAGYCCV